jgi:hypothetical protein
MYAVTAKHVVDGIAKYSADGNLYLRVNLRIGATIDLKTNVKEWVFHDSDTTVDVAVHLFGIPSEVRKEFDLMALPVGMCATQEVISQEAIGIGDGVFMTGLFTHHVGQRRNIPIVRIGNIAAMPEEPVFLPDFGEAEAYLIESRSVGGLSGSPVFVHLGIVRIDKKGIPVASTDNKGLRTTSGPFYLLGLMHGHYYESTGDVMAIMKDGKAESVNSGIAIIVPATKILEVINQPRLADQRKALSEDIRRKDSPRPDNA